MKNVIFLSLFVLFASSWINAQTNGTLTVAAATSSTGGNYAPKNIVAVWIEDTQGNFVKTLLAYAQNRKTHLNTWEAVTTAAGSPFNTVDAITGATRTSHSTRTSTWDGKDVNSILVADGMYKVWMELTDKNNTGNFSSFNFTKGPDPENQTPANVPSFSSITINWEPVFTSVQDPLPDQVYQVVPNPTTGIIRVFGEGIMEVEVMNLAGSIIFSGQNTAIDLSREPEGIYFVKVTSERGVLTKKVFKK